MTTKPTHTPLPWKVNEDFHRSICIDGPKDEVCIGQLSRENTVETNRANAAFIVLAINAYEGLIQWAKRYAAACENNEPYLKGNDLEILKQAIINAELI